MKHLILSLFIFSIYSDLYADDISEEILKVLNEKNIQVAVVSLIDKPVYDKAHPVYDFTYLRNKVKSEDYLRGNKICSNYEKVMSNLPEFSYLLFNGKKMPLNMKEIRPLIEAIVNGKTKRIIKMIFNRELLKDPKYDFYSALTPQWSRHGIAQGILIVLIRDKKTLFAFDMKSPKQVIMPFEYNKMPGRFYKLYVDEKNRLYMFDSYLYFPDKEAKALSTKLWQKLDIVTTILPIYKDRKKNPRAFYGDFTYTPRASAKDKKSMKRMPLFLFIAKKQ